MKLSNQQIFLFVIALFGACPALAKADSFRCPPSGKIIHEGESFGEVVSKCGEPDFRSQPSVIFRRINDVESKALQVEEWTYDFGPNRFIEFLTFEGGRLRRLEHGGYGTTK